LYGNQKKHCQIDYEKDKAFSHQGINLTLLGAILCSGFQKAVIIESMVLFKGWHFRFKKGSVFEFLPFFEPLTKIQKPYQPTN
jgi:hypothetical protein